MRIVSYIHRPGEGGKWYDETHNTEFHGNGPMMYANDQAAWLACAVFDGGRYFEGVMPDIELHCQRAINSAGILRLNVPIDAAGLVAIVREAVSKFPKDALLYIRPEIWATKGIVMADVNSAAYAVVVTEAPWPKTPFTASFSAYCRPDPRSGPTLAKAIGAYPTLHLALLEAKDKGFDTGIMLDLQGNIAEFTTANLCIVKGDMIRTPKPNGTFLNGITRQRRTA
jgi:branched-chain amino acid aminotransferase